MAAHAAKQVATGYKRSAAAMASDPILASKVTAQGVPDWGAACHPITQTADSGAGRAGLGADAPTDHQADR